MSIIMMNTRDSMTSIGMLLGVILCASWCITSSFSFLHRHLRD
jgi:hypothetical protein